MKAKDVVESCLYVDDLDAAEDFYLRVLGLSLLRREPDRHVFFRCGQGVVLLFDPRATTDPSGDVPPHGALGSGHLAFAMATSEASSWREQLHRHGVEIEREVQWPGGALSIYFRDPAGNSLELVTPSLWGLGDG